jgi:hypothetical protein
MSQDYRSLLERAELFHELDRFALDTVISDAAARAVAVGATLVEQGNEPDQPLGSAIGYLLSGDAHPPSGRKVALDSERIARGLQVVSQPCARHRHRASSNAFADLRIFSTRFTSKTQGLVK